MLRWSRGWGHWGRQSPRYAAKP